MSLEESIRHYAHATPEKTAVIAGSAEVSYSRLYRLAQQKAAKLKADGLQEGQPFVLRATQDVDFIVTYLAVHLCQAICVPLDKSAPEERLVQVRNMVREPQSNSPSVGRRLAEGQCERADGKWINSQCLDILFTTGSTGRPKGVMLTAEAWEANAENLIDRHGYGPDLLFIICGPMSHLGSLSKLHATFTAGAALYIIEDLRDLGQFFSIFRLPYEHFATFLVPSSIRLLLSVAARELAEVAGKIDFIETGAAPISQADMERLCRLLPETRLFNTYASTETGIVCSYEFSRYGCQPAVVGLPMKHAKVRLDGEGRVVCSGKTIMAGYVGDGKLTRQVLRDGEVFTSDLGSLDALGRLCIHGRTDDIINVGGYKVNPIEVEDAVLSLALARDCICIPARHHLIGTVPKLLYVPHDGNTLSPKDIATGLKQRLENYKIPLLYEPVTTIKHTFNGKPDRKAYID